MTTELQNKVWSILPKEFKEEVKEIYLNAVEHHPCGYNHKTDLMKYLFGRHNLTSDEEGEEILTCKKSEVQRAYNTSREIVKAENPDSLMYSMHTQIMCVLENIFGSKCLPDAHEDNFTSIEPKPAEPKFKIGDELALDKRIVVKVDEVFADGKYLVYSRIGNIYIVKESDLKPYTEQREDLIPPNSGGGELESQEADKQFNTIIKDSFAKERRLNIAAQIVASIVGSDDWTTWRGGTNKEIWHNMAKSSLEIADALIAECEKGEDNAAE